LRLNTAAAGMAWAGRPPKSSSGLKGISVMAEKKRMETLHGFVPGEVTADYEVSRDGNTITLTGSDGEPRSIPVAYHDPLFWYQAGKDAAAAGKKK